MGGMIKIVGNTGGQKNASPEIRNLRTDGTITPTSFTIKYIAEDFENTILRHYIYIDGEKKEITKDVGYEKSNNEFNYMIDNLSMGTTYNIRIEVTDGIDTVRTENLAITTLSHLIYGVRVMENNSNSETCCTYIESAIGTQPANSTSFGGWRDKFPFNELRIVGFKNGQEVGNGINPQNKKHYWGGYVVPADVDVMVKIPKIYWKINNIENGYEILISKGKFDGSDCFAHKVNGVEKDYIYVGAYLGSVENGKLRSKADIAPTISQNINQMRNYAHANGEGYQQMNWFTLALLQNLFILAFKNLNSQSALGMGVCSLSYKLNTGATFDTDWMYGTQNKRKQIVFLGMEDFYGNIWQFIDGIFIDESYNILITPDNKTFNDNGSGYKNIGTVEYTSGNISKVLHTNEGGFLPIEGRGSTTTHYADSVTINNNSMARFGGDWAGDLKNGAFSINISCKPNTQTTFIGSRLCYLGV